MMFFTGSAYYDQYKGMSVYEKPEFIDLHLRPEFTYELVLGVPYAKWLHDNKMLGTVYTSRGMRPYYYFAHLVIEQYDQRTIDNNHSGVNSLPNNWLHHNAMAIFGRDYSVLTDAEKVKANGVLDYTKWTPPNYLDEYKDCKLYIKYKEKFTKPLIIINNQFNIEKGMYPTRFYDIECLYIMIEMLKDKYQIVYNRPTNTEFVIDENENASVLYNMSLEADVEGFGKITDFELMKHYPGTVYLFSDLLKESNDRESGLGYNDFQLRLFARAHGFIGLVGGAGTLSCFYKKPTIMYESVSRAIAPGYWSKDSYYQMLSGGNAHPVIDKRDDQIARGGHDYHRLYELIDELFL